MLFPLPSTWPTLIKSIPFTLRSISNFSLLISVEVTQLSKLPSEIGDTVNEISLTGNGPLLLVTVMIEPPEKKVAFICAAPEPVPPQVPETVPVPPSDNVLVEEPVKLADAPPEIERSPPIDIAEPIVLHLSLKR